MTASLDPKKSLWHTFPAWWQRLKPLARQHRHAPTPAEDRLWQAVRRNQLGVHTRRQHTIERFIVDFYCPGARLVIEIDGSVHDYTAVEDALRQEYLETCGLQVLRFSNEQVFESLDTVLDSIRRAIHERTADTHPQEQE